MTEINIIKFYADWCAPCKMLTPTLKEVEKELITQGYNVIITEINIDKFSELAKELNVTTIPYVIIKKNGLIITDFKGVLTKKDILKRLV